MLLTDSLRCMHCSIDCKLLVELRKLYHNKIVTPLFANGCNTQCKVTIYCNYKHIILLYVIWSIPHLISPPKVGNLSKLFGKTD